MKKIKLKRYKKMRYIPSNLASTSELRIGNEFPSKKGELMMQIVKFRFSNFKLFDK